MAKSAFDALVDLIITWLLFSCILFFAMQFESGRQLVGLVAGQASVAPLKWLVPSVAFLVVVILIVGALSRVAQKGKYVKELIGTVLSALGGGFATVASGMFYAGFLHYSEWLGMLVSGIIGWVALFASKRMSA